MESRKRVSQGVGKHDEQYHTGTTDPTGKPTTLNRKAAGAEGVNGSNRKVR